MLRKVECNLTAKLFVCGSYIYWKSSSHIWVYSTRSCVKDSVVRMSTVYRMIFNRLEYFCFGRRKFSVAHYFVCSLQQSHTSHGSRGTLMTPLTDERLASSWGILRPRGGNVQHCASTTPAPDVQPGNAQHTAKLPNGAPEKRGQQGSGRRPRGKLRPLMLAGQQPQRPI